jgi:hypothetical protein
MRDSVVSMLRVRHPLGPVLAERYRDEVPKVSEIVRVLESLFGTPGPGGGMPRVRKRHGVIYVERVGGGVRR